ncbi:hypothetical protein [Catenuloplanes atrovinosus]|uniref:FtsK domain-containing protein n=1 Tax=Catenuloplanes atrovinosus TaxID=137266 RepID=A0AAE3YUL4_9ACTN|nr:hypothetical protein [Catenuloplanes atrovinosus]MDR7278956.1 hypothetical protein [Catenuloplanes atrovinosus]
MKTKLRPANDGIGSVHTVRLPLWPYLITPLCAFAALPLTWGAHILYGTDADTAGWTGVLLTICAGVLIAFVAWSSRPRGVVMQVMATGVTVLSAAWVIPAVLSGPISKGMLGVWFVGGLLMSIIVAVYRIMRQARGDADGDRSAIRGEMGELGAAVKQLKDAAIGRPQVAGAKVSAQVVLPPGQTFAEVQGARSQIASALDVGGTAVRTHPDPDSERRGRLDVVPVDQLRDPVPWPGPSAPGGSIALPVVLGKSEDGEPLQLHLVGDHAVQRNAIGILGVVGMSGSGKTELLLTFCAEVLTRHDEELRIIDARKGDQLPSWLHRHAAQVTTGRNAAEDVIEALRDEIPRRAKQLGERGIKQWQEGCGIPHVTVLIFEAAAVVAGNGDLVDLSEAVRSVGMTIVLELQRATHDRLPTSARSNIPAWICLGVKDEADAEAALTDEQADAGAAPWKWKALKPGYCYASGPGIEPERAAMPARGFAASEEEREHAVDSYRGHTTQPAATTPVPPAPASDEPNDERAELDALTRDDPPDDVDPAEPIKIDRNRPRFDFAPAQQMSPADARDELRRAILLAAERGMTTVKPEQMSPVLAATGMSGSWLYKALREMSDGPDALLAPARDRGHYRILVPQRA